MRGATKFERTKFEQSTEKKQGAKVQKKLQISKFANFNQKEKLFHFQKISNFVISSLAVAFPQFVVYAYFTLTTDENGPIRLN